MPTITSAPSTIVSAGSWTGTTDIYVSNDLRAQVFLPDTGTTYPLIVGGFNFSSIPAGSTVDQVTVTYENYVEVATGNTTLTGQLFTGTTGIGTPTTLTVATTEAQRTFTVSGVTLSQLQNDLRLQLVASKATANSRTHYVDYVAVTVDYTEPVNASGTATIRDIKWSQTVSSGALSVTKPTGTASGDLLIAIQQDVQNGTLSGLTAPAGWNLLGSGYTITDASGPFTHNAKAWYKIAGGSEGSSYSFSSAGTNGHTVEITAINPGTNYAWPGTPVTAGYNGGNTVQTTQTVPSLTGESGGLLLAMWSQMIFAETNSYTPPSGMTEVFDIVPATFRINSMYATQSLNSSGATGSKTATAATAREYVSTVVAIAAPVLSTITHSSTVSSTASATAGIGGQATYFRAESSTAAATVVNGGQATYFKAETATAAATFVNGGAPQRIGAVPATAVASVSLYQGPSGIVSPTAAATPVIAGRKTVSFAVSALAAASAVNGGVRQHLRAVNSTAVVSSINGGATAKAANAVATATAAVLPQRTLMMHANALIGFTGTGTIAPMKNRISTVLITTDLSGDTYSITGMQGTALVGISGPSTLTVGPPARFTVNIDAVGRFSAINELIENLSIEVGATGNLRVVQSLTTILEEGLPALLTPPSPSPDPQRSFTSEPEPVPVPVFDRIFFGLRR